jgi:predicted amidophosphoribosyltransferase
MATRATMRPRTDGPEAEHLLRGAESGGSVMSAKCKRCGGKLRSDNRYGYCQRTPECRREHHRLRQQAHRETHGRDPRRTLFDGAQRRAKRDGVPFELTMDTMPEIPETCPVCFGPIRQAACGASGIESPTLDRVVPKLGYVDGNV